MNLNNLNKTPTGINPATPQTQSFGYDSLNRLTSASATGGLNGNGNYRESYSYNANTGNLASKTGLGNYTYNAQVTCAAGTRTIPHAVSSAGGNSYTYDCNGSQIQRNVGGTQNLSYNAENKLVSVSGTVSANFVYDGDGKRVKSTINGSSVVYIGNDYEWTSSGVTQYYTSGSQRVVMRRSGYAANNGLFWLMGDHLGSTSITASANGSIYSEQRYTAWGTNRYTSGSLLSQRQYTGQINDGFGLYFYNARFYDPLLARFAQADTIIPAPYNPQDYDRFNYVRNNPLRYTDPTGHFCYDPKSNKFSEGDCYDDMQQKLLEIFIEQLESGKYSDLELAQNLIKQALLLNSDPVIALRAASEIVRRDTPSGGGWSYEKGKFYYKRHSNENFDDSGFGELADIIQPNQIGHFVAEAYIAAYQKRARFGVNPDLLVWGHEIKNLGSQPIKQIQIEQDLGYIAVDLGEILVINSALTPDEQLALAIDAVETAVSSIQSYSYADAHPITYWWNTFKWPWSK